MLQRSISIIYTYLEVGNVVDIQPNQQPMSDDQELAKVLSGITDQVNDLNAEAAAPAIDPATTPVADDPATAPLPDPIAQPEEPVIPAVESVEQPQIETPPVPASDNSSLDGIKQDAIHELRPLVDKLDLQPEEKFDTYLLLLRSTDDKDLIAPAHEAAKNIPDETKKAQALLDIIKEIDYLSGHQAA